MKILVTGGAGFIGSHVVDGLVSKGHEVVILDNFSSGVQENVPAGVNVAEGDIRNLDFVKSLFFEGNFDAVFHLAAQIDVRASVADPVADAETNILASLNLIEAAAKSGVKTFIFSSSGGAIYGETDLRPTVESHSEHPLSPYGIGKLSIDKYLAFYALNSQMRTVSLRYANVYGPRQNPHGEAGVVSIFFNKMLHQENPFLNGDGNQTRDYVFVEDVAQANILALENPNASGVYNIGTGQETSVKELFQKINTLFGNTFKEEHAPAKPGEQMTSSLNSERAQTELGWSSRVPLEEGLQKTHSFFASKL